MAPGGESKKLKQSAAEIGEDRITDLPLDLRLHVLSFLPAQDAVRTCVLSRRWREVWKSMRVLRCTHPWSWESPSMFNKFVNHLLFLRDLLPLDEFELSIYPYAESIVGPSDDRKEPVRYARMWIQDLEMRDCLICVHTYHPIR
ncbi:hypothetical protein ACP4OV_014512 [Aristida adscensionis]